MHRRLKTRTATALFAGFCAFPAAADVAPEDVWQWWQDMFADMGHAIEVSSERREGDTLVLEGINMTVESPDGSTSMAIAELEFTDRGDGSVGMTLSPELPFSARSEVPGQDAILVEGRLRFDDFEAVITGDPDDMTYDYGADYMGVLVDSVTGEAIETALNIEMFGRELRGTDRAQQASDGTLLYSSDFQTSAAGLRVAATQKEGEGRIALSVDYPQGVEGSGSAALVDISNAADLESMLEAGYDSAASIRHGGMTASFVSNLEGEESRADVTSESGTLGFSLSRDGLEYAVGNQGLDARISATNLMLPEIAFQIAESRAEIDVPLVDKGTPSPFSVLLSLSDLELGDAIWAWRDPQGVLPRDPASLEIDLTGTLSEIGNEDATEGAPIQLPAKIESLAVRNLLLRALGAELQGSGAFSFTYGAPTMAPWMPSPAGSLELKMDGVHDLIDGLVALGVLPQDQAQGAMMMLGFFARPGDTPGSLVSRIEITEDGKILANGQRAN